MGFSLLMDVMDDIRFSKRGYGNMVDQEQSEEYLPVDFLMRKRKIFDWGTADTDYVMYLNGNLSIPCDPPHELSVENGDDSDDPQYTLFLSRLKKDGSSYILKADERIGLTKSFKYEEDDSDDVGQEDINGPPDEDYAFFCKNLRFSAHDVIFHHDSDLSEMYERQVSQSPLKDNNHGRPSSSKQMSKLSLHSKRSSSSSEEERYGQQGKRKKKKCSRFRVKIMRILRKPYDKEEHQKLWQDITLQKAQLKHIDLRSGHVRFIESDKIGKSYLEHHVDLKLKVKAAARDDCKQLNLLRGFFFWIQNLTQEGSFYPWKDEECLAARPEA